MLLAAMYHQQNALSERPFVKGQSDNPFNRLPKLTLDRLSKIARRFTGNPKGRPNDALDIRVLFRQHTPDALAALLKALKQPRYRVGPKRSFDPQARVHLSGTCAAYSAAVIGCQRHFARGRAPARCVVKDNPPLSPEECLSSQV